MMVYCTSIIEYSCLYENLYHLLEHYMLHTIGKTYPAWETLCLQAIDPLYVMIEYFLDGFMV